MVSKLRLALIVAVSIVLELPESNSATNLQAVEGGSVQLECQIPASASAASAVKLIRLSKSGALVFERHGKFKPSLGAGFFHRLKFESPSERMHRFNLSGILETDEGLYSCSIELENGESSAEKFHLQVWLLPKFEFDASVSLARTLRRQQGEYVVLRCPNFRGRPRPRVTWLVNERRIVNRGRFRIDPQRPELLQVYNLNANDSGRYACRIENPYGVSEYDVTVLVDSGKAGATAAPVVFIHRPPPSQVVASEGTTLQLPCGYYADPRLTVRIHWQRARAGLWSAFPSSSTDSVAPVKQNSSLIFKPLDHRHSGIYRCQVIVTEADGSELTLISRSSNLTVLHAPALLPNASQPQFLPLGLPGSLTCPVIANPPVGATEWSRNSSPIGGAFIGRLYRFNLVTPSHAGSYRCRAIQTVSSRHSWSSWTPEFIVKTVQPPRFITRPLPLYQLAVGHSVHLPCTFWSPPEVPADVVWLRDGKRIDYRDQRLAHDPVENRLSVQNVQIDLGGTYTCAVDNPVTALTVSTRLVVELVPQHPPTNLTVLRATPFSFDLLWQPAFDAGRPVHYTVWYRRHGSAWQSQSADPPTSTQATVIGLAADEVYELSLTSRSIGGSELEMRVRPETVTARTAGFSSRLVDQPLPRDRSGRVWFPPIERNLGPLPGPPVPQSFDTFTAGVLRIAWRPPSPTPIPVLYYRLEVNVWDGTDAQLNGERWEEFMKVLEPQASLSVDSLPLLRVRTAQAVANSQRLRLAASSCALLSRSRRVVVADVDHNQLARLLPAGSVAAALAAAGVNRVPAGAAWALLSCLLSFLVLAGALIGLSRSSNRDSRRQIVVVNPSSGIKDHHVTPLQRKTDPQLRPQRPSELRHQHRCRSRRCCCHQQQHHQQAAAVASETGISSEHPLLRSSGRQLADRPVSEPESGFQSPSRGGFELNFDDEFLADADAEANNDDDVSVSDIESTLPPGSGEVHGWSRRLPISVYLASYHRIRQLRRASFPIYRESELL